MAVKTTRRSPGEDRRQQPPGQAGLVRGGAEEGATQPDASGCWSSASCWRWPCSPTRSTCSWTTTGPATPTWRRSAPTWRRRPVTRRPRRRPRATRTTWPTAPRSPTPSSHRPPGSTTRRRRRSPSTSTRWPTGRRSRRWCTTWNTATRSPGTATARRTTWSTRRAGSEDLRRRRLRPGRQVHRGAVVGERTAVRSPTGKNVVLTRWTASPRTPATRRSSSASIRPAERLSGQAIKDFMAKYPVANSPEPNGA